MKLQHFKGMRIWGQLGMSCPTYASGISQRFNLTQGGHWNALLRKSWSKNPELLPKIEPRNPWIKGRNASHNTIRRWSSPIITFMIMQKSNSITWTIICREPHFSDYIANVMGRPSTRRGLSVVCWPSPHRSSASGKMEPRQLMFGI